MNNLSCFAGYIYSETVNYINDGFPVSRFMANDSLRYDFAKIDYDERSLNIYNGLDIVEKVPLNKVKEKYVQIRKSML
jgi:hypothetical protein